ncbi:MAG: primosomal protein N' [Candidatus Nanopelagicales bacterium]
MARVVVDIGLPHLDRLFDYAVPDAMSVAAQPGVRVRVRFAGRLVGGYVVERRGRSDHEGRLARLERVVSPEPVLSPDLLALARAVADRYAGTLADVLRLAIPPRHASVEKAARAQQPPTAPAPMPEPGPWTPFRHGTAFLAALARGDAARLVWPVLPGVWTWPRAVAVAAQAALSGARGSLIVVPDARDAALVAAALAEVVGKDEFVALSADLGPAERYRRWLAVARGQVRVVVGPRAAAFAPVHDLGLVVVWDDGDDLHAEPRAPYPHTRDVLALRSHLAGSAFLLGCYAMTAEAAQLVRTGWAQLGEAPRAVVRRHAARVRVAGGDSDLASDPAARTARLPTLAWQVAREALQQGPVLVQVPRGGYVPGLACESCRAGARCANCSGPLGLDQGGRNRLSCRWCATVVPEFRCQACGGNRLRALAIGARRTAEELGRAFPSVPIRTSGRDGVLDSVDAKSVLVVATPGAEPLAEGGYAAALLLDGDRLLARTDLRAAEEALRRWMNASALVRPHVDGGRVVLCAAADAPVSQALMRWDPVGSARRELDDRVTVKLPPGTRLAELTGIGPAVAELLDVATLPDTATVLGPVPAGEGTIRALVRVPRSDGLALAHALHAAAGIRSARKLANPVRVRIDPADLR